MHDVIFSVCSAIQDKSLSISSYLVYNESNEKAAISKWEEVDHGIQKNL